MANRSLGTLTMDLIAKIGGFESGLDQAARVADKRSKDIEKSLDRLSVKTVAIGTAIGQGLQVAFERATQKIPELINGLDALNDVADATGTTVENASALEDLAVKTGTTLENVSGILVKFNSVLKEVDGKNGPSQALKALGLSADELKKIDPAEALRKTAIALNEFADDGNKARIVQELFGKSVKEAAPFLKDLAEATGLVAKVTTEQAGAAERFNKQLYEMQAAALEASRALLSDLLPTITRLTQEINEGRKAFGSYFDAFIEIGMKTNPFDSWGENAKKAQGDVQRLAAEVDRLQKGGRLMAENAGGAAFVGPGGNDAARSRLAAAQKELEAATKRKSYFDALVAKAVTPEAERLEAAFYGTNKPTIGNQIKHGGAGGADDPTKNLLENQLKLLEHSVSEEQALMAQRNKMLDLYFGEGLVTVTDYYKQRQTIQDLAVEAQSAAYDKEIRALQDYIAHAPKATDQASAQGKLNDVLAKQTKLHQEAGQAAVEGGVKAMQATRAQTDALNELNAKLLDFQGKGGEAAAIRFDAQNRLLRQQLGSANDTASIKSLDQLRSFTVEQARLNELQSKYGLITGDLQLAEERISVTRQLGASTELDSLIRLGEERRKAVDQLREMLRIYEGTPAAERTAEQVQQVERLRVEIEKLNAQANPLGDKLESIFSDSFGNSFADFITGAKTAKEAFRDFSNSVISQLARMASQELSKGIFRWIAGAVGTAAGAGAGGDMGITGIMGLAAPVWGGNRASGGPVGAGGMFEVNEGGDPELLRMNGRNFLMMGRNGGAVVPAVEGGIDGRGGAGGVTINNFGSQKVTAERRADGRTEITVRELAAGMSDPSNPLSKAIERSFGLQRNRQ